MQKLVEKQARESELKAIEQRLAGNTEARAASKGSGCDPRRSRRPQQGVARHHRENPDGRGTLGRAGEPAGLLQSSEAAIRRSLEGRRNLIAEVLAALQRIGRRPPPAVLVRPEDILEAVRASMLLGAVVPGLRQEVEILGTDLAELVRLRRHRHRKGRSAPRWSRSASGSALPPDRGACASARPARPRTSSRGRARQGARRPGPLDAGFRREDREGDLRRQQGGRAARQAIEQETREQRERMTALAFKDPARLAPKIAFAEAKGLPSARIRITIAWFRRS
jgi:hypothetical protein